MKLGVSVYLSKPISDQISFLKQASDSGFTTLFTSLHIPEDDASLYQGRLKEVGAFAQANQLDLIADVSPASLEHLQLNFTTASRVNSWGVTGLRLDYGISIGKIIKLSTEIKIILNASTLTKEDAQKLISSGLNPANVEVWHNFYPRPETGLCREDFYNKNKWLTAEGFSIMSFVPGDEKRGPLYNGLPTLEEHRFVSPFAACIDFIKNEDISTVVIGDVGLKYTSLKQFKNFQQTGVLTLRAYAQLDIEELTLTHTNRKDNARDVLRSEHSRSVESYGKRNIKPVNTNKRPLGTITMDNRLYGRYQGEIQITKRDLPSDEKVNVLGRVIEEDLLLIKLIKGGDTWRIEWI